MNEKVSIHAHGLQEAFRRSFAEPARAEAGAAEERLLCARISGRPYAIRISEVEEILTLATDRIMRMPSALSSFWGLTSVHGEIIPVYGLGALIGAEEAMPGRPWLAIVGAKAKAALGFRTFEGHLGVPGGRIVPVRAASAYERAIVESDEPRAIIDIEAVFREIRRLVGLPDLPEGRIAG